MYRKDCRSVLNEADRTHMWICARSFMSTWQGDFGIIGESGYTQLLNDADALTIDLVNNEIRRDLFSSLGKWCANVIEEYHLLNTSWCTGLCTDTFGEKWVARVQRHACLEARAGKKLHVRNIEGLKFEGALAQTPCRQGPRCHWCQIQFSTLLWVLLLEHAESLQSFQCGYLRAVHWIPYKTRMDNK